MNQGSEPTPLQTTQEGRESGLSRAGRTHRPSAPRGRTLAPKDGKGTVQTLPARDCGRAPSVGQTPGPQALGERALAGPDPITGAGLSLSRRTSSTGSSGVSLWRLRASGGPRAAPAHRQRGASAGAERQALTSNAVSPASVPRTCPPTRWTLAKGWGHTPIPSHCWGSAGGSPGRG